MTQRLDALGSYIAQQRWSGARGEAVRDARLESEVPIGRPPLARQVVVAAEVDGATVRYQLWLPAADAPTAGEVRDALESAEVRREIVRLLAEAARIAGRDASLRFEPEAGAEPTLRALESSSVGRAEQSNTSIVYDGAVIVKLFRRLEAGEQPDVEMTRFLTRRGFPGTPPLLGTVTTTSARGTAVAAMAQRFVRGAGDAWTHVVGLARAAAHDGADADQGAEARRIGTATRALHDALASDPHDAAFAPEPADAAATARWAAAAARSVESGVALLRERLADGTLDALPAHMSGEARRVAAAGGEELGAFVRDAADAAGDDAGCATRHHGDYHLGQVLRAGDGALHVIDFEGEPAKPLDERRAKHSPLRDVAGMLRSFAYAAATVALERPGDHDVAARAARWENTARAAFLDGYFARGTGGYLPRSRTTTEAILSVFEVEKLFYELQYELRNRPAWVPIPLTGIGRLRVSTGATPSTPTTAT